MLVRCCIDHQMCGRIDSNIRILARCDGERLWQSGRARVQVEERKVECGKLDGLFGIRISDLNEQANIRAACHIDCAKWAATAVEADTERPVRAPSLQSDHHIKQLALILTDAAVANLVLVTVKIWPIASQIIRPRHITAIGRAFVRNGACMVEVQKRRTVAKDRRGKGRGQGRRR